MSPGIRITLPEIEKLELAFLERLTAEEHLKATVVRATFTDGRSKAIIEGQTVQQVPIQLEDQAPPKPLPPIKPRKRLKKGSS